MKITKYIDKDWFRRWWKDYKYIPLFCLALLTIGVIIESLYLISRPLNYSLEDTGCFTGKCYKIETQTYEVFKRTWVEQEAKVLHMSDGQTYFQNEIVYHIFDVSALMDNIDDKIFTIRYDLRESDFGYVIMHMEDQDGNVYLSFDDMVGMWNQNRICIILVFFGIALFFFIVAGCFHYPMLFDHIRENIRREKRREHKKEKRLARQQRFLDDPDSFKKNKKKK